MQECRIAGVHERKREGKRKVLEEARRRRRRRRYCFNFSDKTTRKITFIFVHAK